MNMCLTMKLNNTVEKKPPMKPSHVFLGESCKDRALELWSHVTWLWLIMWPKSWFTLMSGVRPKKNPNRYAIMSLQMTMEIGTINLNTGRKHGVSASLVSAYSQMFSFFSEILNTFWHILVTWCQDMLPDSRQHLTTLIIDLMYVNVILLYKYSTHTHTH